MRLLLDTNIVVHRETAKIMNRDIGTLFYWIDKMHYEKIVHPITIDELFSHKDPIVLETMKIKVQSYNILKTVTPLNNTILGVVNSIDKNNNDKNDTLILNEVYSEKVDCLITEDKKIHKKAKILGINSKVYTIEAFIEKIVRENPDLVDYKVLSIEQAYFGSLNLEDEFFNTLKEDYTGFENWFLKKSDEKAYIFKQNDKILAFLYLKVENENENYSDINPPFLRKKRLKIGTFKVVLNGYKLGERFLKIIFDNAIINSVEEIYVTIYDRRSEQIRLSDLFKDFGFNLHGKKGEELVLIKNMKANYLNNNPREHFPYINIQNDAYIVAIYPDYHTSLLPDSILKTELADDFNENESFRNAIKKVYISRSYERSMKKGDIVIFYRTGGFYKSVITTIGVIENIIFDIKDEKEFIELCGKRSVFDEEELKKHWNYSNTKPFIVEFLYSYSLPKRLNMKRLIELGVIADVKSAPRGFFKISKEQLEKILLEASVDGRYFIN